jgi:hypothetical protein
MQGASQAIEDGVVLAVTLQLAGKAKVPLALRAWETIRSIQFCLKLWLTHQWCCVLGIKE